MSNLEGVVKPFVEPMLHDNARSLDTEQQQVLAAWTVKIAMVLEGARRDRQHFYTRAEAESLRLNRAIPARSLIWLGRIAEGGLHAGGIDLRLNVDNIAKIANGCVTTIVVGHLILQVLTAHYPLRFAGTKIGIHCKDGPWQESLLGIWPSLANVEWPPLLEFSLHGRLPLVLLGDRWRYGTRFGT